MRSPTPLQYELYTPHAPFSADRWHFEESLEFTVEQAENLMDTKLELLSDDRAELVEAGGSEANTGRSRKKRVKRADPKAVRSWLTFFVNIVTSLCCRCCWLVLERRRRRKEGRSGVPR